uniref:EGF-like domain-containing protein n=1 Tax=Heterorhabditis bacteriophora TaxID=37862 RepID=A0A1I7WRG9_HETBA
MASNLQQEPALVLSGFFQFNTDFKDGTTYSLEIFAEKRDYSFTGSWNQFTSRDSISMWNFVLIILELPILSAHISLTFPETRYPPLDFLDTSRTMGPCGVPRPKLGEFEPSSHWSHNKSVRDSLIYLNPLFSPLHKSHSGKHIQFHVENAVSTSEVDKCNGRGVIEDDQCICEQGFTGNVCQYRTDCHRDSDCLNGGRCISQSRSLVTMTCYCAYGFFGKNCEQNFNHKDDTCFAYNNPNTDEYEMYGMFNSNCYNKEKFNLKDAMYYRFIKAGVVLFKVNEIEIILDFTSTSWVSIGWRPDGLDPSCRLFPDLEGVRAKRSTIIETVSMMSTFRPQTLKNSSQPTDLRQAPPSKIAQKGPRPVLPKNNGMLDSALKAPLHAMDCIDVFLGDVKDGRVKVLDMYDGEMSLIAAAGVQIDGRTVIMFRRSVQEIEPTDHPIGPGRLFVVWAKGENSELDIREPLLASPGNHSSSFISPNNQLRYHGKKFVCAALPGGDCIEPCVQEMQKSLEQTPMLQNERMGQLSFAQLVGSSSDKEVTHEAFSLICQAYVKVDSCLEQCEKTSESSGRAIRIVLQMSRDQSAKWIVRLKMVESTAIRMLSLRKQITPSRSLNIYFISKSS